MIPRYGSSPKSARRYRKRPGVYAIIPRGDDILLTHQAAPIPEFQLPGGGVDPGENPLSALFREVLEETGWRVSKPRRFGAFRRFTYMPEYDLWAEKLCVIYVAQPVMEISSLLEDGHTAVWAPARTAIPLLGNDGDQALLARYLTSTSAHPA